jgi:hypothetical protein
MASAHPQADEAAGQRREDHRSHPRLARNLPGAHAAQHLHRRLSRRDREPSSRNCSTSSTQAQLDRVGCFTYSPVDRRCGQPLPDPVPEEVKQERLARFMEKQAKISAERLARKVGSVQQVLVDEVTPQGAIGRSKADAPQIDGLVYLHGKRQLTVGEWVEARIEHSDEHDLFGLTLPPAEPGH